MGAGGGRGEARGRRGGEGRRGEARGGEGRRGDGGEGQAGQSVSCFLLFPVVSRCFPLFLVLVSCLIFSFFSPSFFFVYILCCRGRALSFGSARYGLRAF